MNNKLFVGNLSFNTTENDLQDTFAAHGTVLEANLMMDRATGRPRGFAFITMSTDQEAQSAINALNGDRKSTRLNSSHANISYAVFCLKKKKEHQNDRTSSWHTS